MMRALSLGNGSAQSSPSSAAAKLYRHALESIFSFCSLEELTMLLRVSKEWATAVNSMHPLDARVPWTCRQNDSRLLRFCMSPLPRHVGTARLWQFPMSPSLLYNLTLRMTNLQELDCHFEGSWSPLVFPARLRELTLRFQAASDYNEPFSNKQHRELDEAIVAIAALPQLEELSLNAYKARSCCLTPLVTAPALHSLTLNLPSDVFDSPAAIDALRRMPHLRSLSFDPSAESFTRMLQSPHAMKLEALRIESPFTAEFGKAIVRLPALTDLDFPLGSLHTDFLRQMPNLRCLQLLFYPDLVVALDTDRIMHSLHSLTGLTELRIEECNNHLRYTADHLTTCLSHMPWLTGLHLSYPTALDSLRFLSSGPITRSLKTLHLTGFRTRLPLAELLYVHELSSLTELTLYRVFDRALDEYTQSLYTPPSRLMPSLLEFVHYWEAEAQAGEESDEEEDEVEEEEE
jgi:hypothetical protein